VTVSARAEGYDLVVPAALPAYRISDPAVLAFVLIPVLPAVLFAGAVAAAWTRAGRPRAEVVRATSIAGALTATWMAAAWLAAARGALRDLSATPPPFAWLRCASVLRKTRLTDRRLHRSAVGKSCACCAMCRRYWTDPRRRLNADAVRFSARQHFTPSSAAS
jgi:hypothetical protein